MSQQQSSDASFFSLVHHMVEAEHQLPPIDRRTEGRIRVRAVQFIAPYIDGKLPGKHDFLRVIGNDLSMSGFSYLAAHTPPCEYLVVALGPYPHVFLAAQVIHATPIIVDHRSLLVVGCQFIARLKDLEIGALTTAPPENAE